MNADNGTPKRRVTVVWRIVQFLVPGLAVMSLADAHVLRTVKPVSTVFVLDLSDSIESTDRFVSYVSDLAQSQADRTVPDTLQSLIVFGQDAFSESVSSHRLRVDGIKSPVNHHGTNLERALTFAANPMGQSVQGRIVLVSDGNQTEGNLANAVPDLKSRQIHVDVLPIEFSYPNEVWLERLDLPDSESKASEAVIVVGAQARGQGKLVLSDLTGVIAQREIEYGPGTNSFRLPVTLPQSGSMEYSATIEIPASQIDRRGNNSVHNSIHVASRKKVLIVTGESGVQDGLPFKQALEGDSEVIVLPASGVAQPGQVLAGNDLIVFCNVRADEFRERQLREIRTAVQAGTGFLLAGGESFDGYRQTMIEEILPVSMTDLPPGARPNGALVFVLDNLLFNEFTTSGKRATKQAMLTMRSTDKVGVLASGDDGDAWAVRLTSADQHQEMFRTINNTPIGRIHSLKTALRMGLDELRTSDAATRHLIILTAAISNLPDQTFLQQFADAGVSMSTVIASPYADAGLDKSALQAIATATGGRYYLTERGSEIPAIFLHEVKTALASHYQSTRFSPTVPQSFRNATYLQGLPELQGYVITTLKRMATQVLNGPGRDQLPGSHVPILATGSYGRGRTAAFTGDWDGLSRWDGLRPFIRQLTGEIRGSNHLRVVTTSTNGKVRITVDDLHPLESELDVQASIIDDSQKSTSIPFQKTGPRRYEVTVPFVQDRMAVTIRARRNERIETVLCWAEYSAGNSRELLQTQSNRAVLEKLAADTNGRVLTGNASQDAAFLIAPTFTQSSQAGFDWFLISLALVIPLMYFLVWTCQETELACHRAMQRPRIISGSTLVSLLKTKLWVTAALSSKGTARLLVQRWSPTPRSATWNPPEISIQPPREIKTHVEDGTAISTIEKLLALKRQTQNFQQS
ncbi:MAG: hypothetical protein JSS49_05880 [Planctomycetes bacterium]|nr:hypothetical protein [Planctomycetota bacterium]